MLYDRVREAREGLGLTLAELARRAAVDPAHLLRFERGEREMSSDKLARVLAALGLDVVQVDHESSSAGAA